MQNVNLHHSRSCILVLPILAAYKSIHGCWITPHTARYCLIARVSNSNLGFTDKAGFSLLCYHKRRLFTNRTHVQRYRHSGFYTCSWYIIIRLLFSLPTGFQVASLIHFNAHPQTVDDRIAHYKLRPYNLLHGR